MRSKFEATVASWLKKLRAVFEYEPFKIHYVWPERKSYYTPDFVIKRNGLVIEAKGKFTAHDRAKHLLIKKQHPEYDIRFCFMNAHQKLHKGAKSTYADWCNKHGFQWCHKVIPKEWVK